MNLFDRIPAPLFSALSGRNNRRMWDLLVRLSNGYFGPDSVPPHPDGYPSAQIVREVERYLLDANWEYELPEADDTTPLSAKANQLLGRLVETGWLVQERVGLVTFVGMSPSVARLLGLLQSFVNDEPQLVGGDILLIHNQLCSVVENPRAQASGFASAARLCVQLINSLNTISIRARDLTRELTEETDTPVFVKRYFDEHVSKLYIQDFKMLRTENHPLRLRFEIIALANQLTQDEALRGQLLQGYADLPGVRAGEVESQLERDAGRLCRLLDVEKFLERLDSVIDAANRRAIAYLGYRLKASERIEAVLADSIRAVIATDLAKLPLEGTLLTPTPLMGDDRLRLPVVTAPKPARTAMRKREMTLEERAMRELRKEMIAHRETTPGAMRRYVMRHLAPGVTVPAAQLPIAGVDDAVSFLALCRLAAISSHNLNAMKRNPLLRRLDFQAELIPGSRVDNEFFNTPNFSVTRKSNDAT